MCNFCSLISFSNDDFLKGGAACGLLSRAVNKQGEELFDCHANAKLTKVAC